MLAYLPMAGLDCIGGCLVGLIKVCSAALEGAPAPGKEGRASDPTAPHPGDEDRLREYTEPWPLLDALRREDTLLIKGSWLLEFVEGKMASNSQDDFILADSVSCDESASEALLLAQPSCALPRRQDLPPEAFWGVEELEARLCRAYGRVKVVAISHSWLSRADSDPAGRKLLLLAAMIREWLLFYAKEYAWDLALFIDWCSWFQAPRSVREQEVHTRAMQTSHVWYVNQWTDVWLLNHFPSYHGCGHESSPSDSCFKTCGWTYFQHALSCMDVKAKASCGASVIDLGKLPNTCARAAGERGAFHDMDWHAIETTCTAERRICVAPSTVAEDLKQKGFACPGERVVLERCYARVFSDVAPFTSEVLLQELNLPEDDVGRIGRVLPLLSGLRFLSLARNNIGDLGAAAVSQALPRCHSLAALDLDQNRITAGGCRAIAAALPACPTLASLSLDDNWVEDAGVESMFSTAPMRLATLSLEANGVGMLGVEALARAAQTQSLLLQKLRIGRNACIGNDGAEALVQALTACCNISSIWLDASGIGNRGAQAIAKALTAGCALHVVQLRRNDISTAGAWYLVGAFEAAAKLEKLGLDGNPICAVGRGKLRAAWRSSGKIPWGLQLGSGVWRASSSRGSSLAMGRHSAGEEDKTAAAPRPGSCSKGGGAPPASQGLPEKRPSVGFLPQPHEVGFAFRRAVEWEEVCSRGDGACHLSVSVPSRRTEHGVVFFVIAASIGVRRWEQCRRFRDFEALDRSLRGRVQDLPALPAKLWHAEGLFSKFLDRRQRDLERWLQAVLASGYACPCQELRAFLGVPNVPGLLPLEV